MSNFLKKTISLMLVILMITATVPVAFGAESESAEYDGDPIVIVRGFDFAGLVCADGSKAISLNFFDILKLLAQMGYWMIKGDSVAEINAFADFGRELLKDITKDEKGIPLNPDVHIPKFLHSAEKMDLSGDEWTKTAVGLFRSVAETYGKENAYLYTFDWRMSPFELADDLNSFFELVKRETGTEKIDVAACSMGGMVITSYVNKYGTDSLDSVVYMSSAHNGAHIVGSVFTGDLVVNTESLKCLLLEKTENIRVLNVLVKVINATCIIDLLVGHLNKIVSGNIKLLYKNLLRECFGTAYGLWALIPDEYFDESIEFLFTGDEEEYAVALEEILKIREFVFDTDNIIHKMYSDGVKVSFVSHYDSRQLPIYSGYEHNGDGVLETDKTSGYATVAKFGEVLTDSETEGVDKQYISPDNVVNVSTCLYKDTTWIVKNAKHVGCKYKSDHTNFAMWLLTSDTQPTVTTNPEYPRFINTDENQDFISFE